MSGWLGAGVHVTIILSQHVYVMEDVAVELATPLDLREPSVHQHPFVEHIERFRLIQFVCKLSFKIKCEKYKFAVSLAKQSKPFIRMVWDIFLEQPQILIFSLTFFYRFRNYFIVNIFVNRFWLILWKWVFGALIPEKPFKVSKVYFYCIEILWTPDQMFIKFSWVFNFFFFFFIFCECMLKHMLALKNTSKDIFFRARIVNNNSDSFSHR